MYGIPEPRQSTAKTIIEMLAILTFVIGWGWAITQFLNNNRKGDHPIKKRMYTINSIPCYDSVGNVWIHTQMYDHVPTVEDSAKFIKESGLRIKPLEDTILY